MRTPIRKEALRQFCRRVELYLKRTRTSPTNFGREVLNDSRFVFDLRYGRRASKQTVKKVDAWLKSRPDDE